MRGWLVLALAACGDDGPAVVVADTQVELAFEIASNIVVVTRTFAKGVPVTLELEVRGSTSAFPGPSQVPLAGDQFVTVEDPANLGGGALAGELPGAQAYELSASFQPATVSYGWYAEDSGCNPGCTRTTAITMMLADPSLGGTAPPEATVQLAFRATLIGWVIDADSPPATSPSIGLTVRDP